MASMLTASASWKKGSRCSFFGKIYEITVKATMQVSATIMGEVLCRKGSFSIPHRPYWVISGGTTPLVAVFNAKFKALQQKVVAQVVAPSIWSQMCSNSIQAWVLIIPDFYLSQQSSATCTNSGGSFMISWASVNVVCMRFRQTETIRWTIFWAKMS